MKREFPIEDIISFTEGHLISLSHQTMTGGPMHDVANFMLNKQLDPYELLQVTDVVAAEICRQHPFLNGFKLDPPAAGWNSLDNNRTTLTAYVNDLHQKLGKKTLEITSAPGIANLSIRTKTVTIH